MSVFDKHSLTEIEETHACIEFEVTEIAGITTKLVAAAELERDWSVKVRSVGLVKQIVLAFRGQDLVAVVCSGWAGLVGVLVEMESILC